MVGFSLGGNKRKPQPGQQAQPQPGAGSAQAEEAKQAFIRTMAESQPDQPGNKPTPTDADAAAAIEGGSRAKNILSEEDQPEDAANTLGLNSTTVELPGAKPASPDIEAGIRAALTENLQSPGNGNAADPEEPAEPADNAQTAGPTGPQPQPEPQPEAQPAQRAAKPLSDRQQAAAESKSLREYLKSKSDAYRKFMREMQYVYGGVYFPLNHTPEYDQKLDALVSISKISKLPLVTNLDIKLDNKKEIHVARDGVHLIKGHALTEDKAYAMALLVYMNPQAHKEGVTLEGTVEEQRVLLAALKKVVALNPDVTPIRINNLGVDPLTAARPQPQPQPQPAQSAASSASASQQPPTHTNPVPPQPQPEMKQSAAPPAAAPESPASSLSESMRIEQVIPTRAAEAAEKRIELSSTDPELSQHILDILKKPENKDTLLELDLDIAQHLGDKATDKHRTTDAEFLSYLDGNPQRRKRIAEKAGIRITAEPIVAPKATTAECSNSNTGGGDTFAKPAGKTKAAAAPNTEVFKSAAGKKWEPSEAAIKQARTYIKRTEDPTLSSLQEHFGIGKTKAGKLMAALEKEGTVVREGDHKTAGWQVVSSGRRAGGNGREAHIG